MTAKFYADTHIDKAITRQGWARGVDIIRCEEVGLGEAEDFEHLEYATTQDRVMLSADKDFPILHAEWQAAGWRHAGIIYIQPDRKDQIGRIMAYLEFIHQAVEGGTATLEEDMYNKILYL